MRLLLTAAGVASVALACGVSFAFRTPPPPAIDLAVLPLPRTDTGGIALIEIAGSRVELAPAQQDPLTAVGRCADLVSYCVSPEHSVDQCMVGARACRTAQPWSESEPCCPTECLAAYQRARLSGRDALGAFDDVVLRAPDCFPGARAALEGQ